MSPGLFKLLTKLRNLIIGEGGQDLVEYALIVALIAFGAAAGMNGLSSAINSAFETVSTTLVSSLT